MYQTYLFNILYLLFSIPFIFAYLSLLLVVLLIFPFWLQVSSCVLVIFDHEFIFLDIWKIFEAMLNCKVCEGRGPAVLFIAIFQCLLQCLVHEVFNTYLLNEWWRYIWRSIVIIYIHVYILHYIDNASS